MRNGVVMDQLILFHKPNKKMRSEKKMDNFIPQTKHIIKGSFGRALLHDSLTSRADSLIE
jgi:hypothetical protein